MPTHFKLKNTHETSQKSLEEKSSKAAVLKEKLDDRKKIAKASERYYKAKAKADKLRAKAKMLGRSVGKMEDKLDSNQEDNEKDVKSATADMQAAKAEFKSAKEVVERSIEDLGIASDRKDVTTTIIPWQKWYLCFLPIMTLLTLEWVIRRTKGLV